MAANRLITKQEIALYAKSLLDAALKEGGLDQALEYAEQLDLIAEVYRGQYDLQVFLKDQTISIENRKQVFCDALSGLHDNVVAVLGVMVERDDCDLLSQLARSFTEELEQSQNIVLVDVTTVVELDGALRQAIKEKVARDFGCDVVLREHLDTDILGGIVMSARGRKIDASCATQLKRALHTLKTKVDGGECS